MDLQTLRDVIIVVVGAIVSGVIIAFRNSSTLKIEAEATRTITRSNTSALQDNLTQGFSSIVTQLNAVHDRLNAAQEDRISDLTRTLGDYGKQLAALTEQQTLTMRQNEQLANDNLALRKDVNGFKHIIDSLRIDLDSAKTELGHQSTYARTLEASLATAKTEYEAQIDRDGKDLRAKQDEIERLTKALTEANDKVARMTDRLNALEVEVKQLNTRVLELEATLVTAQEALKQATTERDALQRKLVQTEAERDQANALVAEHTRQIAALTEQLDTLRAQLATMQGSEQVKG